MNYTEQDFHTSPKLEQLDADIQSTLQRLQEIETERGKAVSDRADGIEEADQRVQNAHNETDRLTRELEDMRAARQVEADRLAEVRRMVIDTANEARRESLNEQRERFNKQAQTIDRDVGKVLREIDKLSSLGQNLSRQFGGTNPYHDAAERAYNALVQRLTTRRTARVTEAVAHSEDVLEQAHYPDNLDDFQKYQSIE